MPFSRRFSPVLKNSSDLDRDPENRTLPLYDGQLQVGDLLMFIRSPTYDLRTICKNKLILECYSPPRLLQEIASPSVGDVCPLRLEIEGDERYAYWFGRASESCGRWSIRHQNENTSSALLLAFEMASP
jgi:hypothetical protein